MYIIVQVLVGYNREQLCCVMIQTSYFNNMPQNCVKLAHARVTNVISK